MSNKKEDRETDRATTQQILSSFRMNIDDAINKIAEKVSGGGNSHHPSHAPSGLVDPNVARQERMLREGIATPTGPLSEHINWDQFTNMAIKPGKKASATNNLDASAALRDRFGGPQKVYPSNNSLNLALTNRVAERFTPIMNQLTRFKFSSTEEKRDSQMNEIVSAMKVTMKKMAIREVVANTKTLYDNADKFFQTENGLRVVFKVASHRVSISVDGEFLGDELICCEQDGTNVSAYVARQGDQGFEDLTANYDIKLEAVAA